MSETALTQAGHALITERPGLHVHALIADFTARLQLPDTPAPAWSPSWVARSATSSLRNEPNS